MAEYISERVVSDSIATLQRVRAGLLAQVELLDAAIESLCWCRDNEPDGGVAAFLDGVSEG